MAERLHGRFSMTAELARNRLVTPVSISSRLAVFLDGQVLRQVVACDTREGWAVVYRRDQDGKICRANGEPQCERLRGDVRVSIDRLSPRDREVLDRTA